jgi:uncharacterized glyoxalase superfamily protein PhnB
MSPARRVRPSTEGRRREERTAVTDVMINPYLQFQDQAREAMTFYRDVFGGDLSMNTYAELGMSGDPSNDDRIMHAQLVTPHGVVLMGADAGFSSPGDSSPTSQMRVEVEVEWRGKSYTTTGFVAGA